MSKRVNTYTATSTSWTAPSGTFNASVELWGAGGTGGPATGTNSAAGGGAGGQYAIKNVSVTVGTQYAVEVPAAPTASNSAKVDGGDAGFGLLDVVAKGGLGADVMATNGGAGAGATGSTSGGIGDTVYAGGSGGTAVNNTTSGGGGGGAGSNGTGSSGSGQVAGGETSENGGAGGNGVTTDNTRNNGNEYGGGGSGAYASGSPNRAGGNGAAGYARISYLRRDFSTCCGAGV